MKRRIEKLERVVRPRPYAHLSDAELQAATQRLARGEPSGVEPYPGPPATWPATGLESLSNDELLARTEALRTQLVGRPRFGRGEQKEEER